MVETQYAGPGAIHDSRVVLHSLVPTLRSQQQHMAPRPLWRRIASRLKRAALVLLRG
jgi:hypothetical protein